MNDDYLIRPGDVFIARECGCSMQAIAGPSDPSMATQTPRCCCGNEMIKDASLIGGMDVTDIKEDRKTNVLPGMVV